MLFGLAAAPLGAALPVPANAGTDSDILGRPLLPWRQGRLDIHHISTGRGDSSLIVCPDGTTIMLDAGAMYDKPRFNLDLTPNATRRPGE